MNAPILQRHTQAAIRALLPTDGTIVLDDAIQESASALTRVQAVAQAIADAELARDVTWAMGALDYETAEIICDALDIEEEDYAQWFNSESFGLTREAVRALVLKGWGK